MKTDVEFDSKLDRRAYAVVAAGAGAASFWHMFTTFQPFMGTAGAIVTPLMLDAVLYWLAGANIRQARAGRPMPLLRFGAYALMGLAITANALGGSGVVERVFLALPAALFAFLVEARTRLALREQRSTDTAVLPWWLRLRHPVLTARARRERLASRYPEWAAQLAGHRRRREARAAVHLVLSGRGNRGRRKTVLRQIATGGLPAGVAVERSGLRDRHDEHPLYLAALEASFGEVARPVSDRSDTTETASADVLYNVQDVPRWLPWPPAADHADHGPGPEDELSPDPLLPAAKALVAAVPDTTRRQLVERLREQGHRVGNDRAHALLRSARPVVPDQRLNGTAREENRP